MDRVVPICGHFFMRVDYLENRFFKNTVCSRPTVLEPLGHPALIFFLNGLWAEFCDSAHGVKREHPLKCQSPRLQPLGKVAPNFL